jgi:hypothetical protein
VKPTRSRAPAAIALAAIALSLWCAALAAAQTPVSGLQFPTPIAAYQGRLVWSQPDGSGRYQLVQRVGDEPVQALPIAPRAVPFDVDLGPTTSGGVYAVYSRCQVEPAWSGVDMPPYETGKGCDVYKLDLATNAEVRSYDLRVDTIGDGHVRVDSTNGGGLSSTVLGWPSFENGRIYWLRSCVGDPGGCVQTRRFQQSQYTGSPTPLVASSPAYVQAHERDQGITWAETDVNSIYGCQTDPVTTPQCAIQPLRPDFAPLN